MKLLVKKLSADAKIPVYAHHNDAGLDLFCVENVILTSGARRAVKTGLSMQLEDGFAGLIWDKSGRAVNDGIKTMAGVIDAGYRGEVQVVLANISQKEVMIKKGEKIAQLLIQPIIKAEVIEVQNLKKSARGQNGFGSTGL